MPADTMMMVKELNSSASKLSRTVVVLTVVTVAVHPGLGTEKEMKNK